MKKIKTQRGMTGISWLFVLLLLFFFTYSLIKLFPIYYEYLNVRSVVNGLADEPKVFSGVSAIRKTIRKRLDINMVSSVNPADITITRESDKYLIDIDYEVRETFIINIDLVVYFNSVIRVPAL